MRHSEREETDYRIYVSTERDRQSEEWDDNIPPEVFAVVLAEEVGEVAQAILDGDLAHAQTELVQVAAICERMYHLLRRSHIAGWEPSWPTEPRSIRDLARPDRPVCPVCGQEGARPGNE